MGLFSRKKKEDKIEEKEDSVDDLTEVEEDEEPKPKGLNNAPILDLVADRVRSRVLSTMIFLVIFTAVAVLVLPTLLIDPNRLKGDDIVTEIRVVIEPTLSVEIGSAILGASNSALKMLLRNEKGFAIENKTISARLEAVSFFSEIMNSVCSLATVSNNPTGSSLPTLNEIPFNSTCYPELVNHQNVSDADGLAIFSNLIPSSAIPGTYLLTFLIDDVSVEYSLSLRTSIQKLSFVNENLVTVSPPESLSVGDKLSDVNVLVTNVVGEPDFNRTVYLLGVSPDASSGTNNDAFATFTSNSARTDENGLATFPSAMALSGFTGSGVVQLVALSEGVYQQWEMYGVAARTDVSAAGPTTLTMATAPPATVTEGRSFAMEVKVVQNGVAASGKIVFAVVTVQDGIALSSDFPQSSSTYNPLYKKLLNASAVTDIHGVARFNMTWSVPFAVGQYSLKAVCEGAETPEHSTTLRPVFDCGA